MRLLILFLALALSTSVMAQEHRGDRGGGMRQGGGHAGYYERGGGSRYSGTQWHGGGGGWHNRYNDFGTGVLGGVIGGIFGNWLSRPEPQVIVVPQEREVQEMTEESQAWYEYCANKYRTFDGASGTYMGFDGLRHRCVVN